MFSEQGSKKVTEERPAHSTEGSPVVATEVCELKVDGMTCASCAASVTRVLRAQAGVLDAQVDFMMGRAQVKIESAQADPRQLVKAVEAAGYQARVNPSGRAVHDAHHASAGSHVHNPDAPSRVEELDAWTRKEMRSVRLKLIVAAILCIPLIWIAMSSHHLLGAGASQEAMHAASADAQVNASAAVAPKLAHQHQNTNSQFLSLVIQLALATPIVVWCGSSIFRVAWKGMLQRTANMDSLVALGVGAAYGWSAFVIWSELFPRMGRASALPPVYFEAAGVIVTLVLLGRWLEMRATIRTRDAVRGLAALQPAMARVRRNAEEIDIPVAEVVIGDLVVVRPGDRVPMDGMVEEGSSELDQSMLTGESVPVTKRAGDEVFAGTLNAVGAIVLRAKKVGGDTVLQQIVKMVQDAQSDRAPVARLADRVSAWFTFAVLGAAVFTFVAWMAFGRGAFAAESDPTAAALEMAFNSAIAVLIIACPCALGLATPTAIMVATGVAARRGILMKGGAAIEALSG
ncbi:MAG: heavy metal translocating P-type ATPase, partial [Planctomycetes bacterium]|nr:heavy metal translocating P-type ATPase [Planctomycetota bacterium]